MIDTALWLGGAGGFSKSLASWRARISNNSLRPTHALGGRSGPALPKSGFTRHSSERVEGAFADGAGGFAGAGGGDFGMGVNDGGHEIPINVAGLAGDPFGDGDAVFLGLVREHRSGDDVADRPHARRSGAELRVDFHAFLFVEFDAGF